MKISHTIPFYHHLFVALLLAFFSPTSEANDDHDMTYVGLAENMASPGGRCMDGSMAGYYIRPGNDPSLFVIFLKGGGGCGTQEDCIARNGTKLGSSRDWDDSMKGTRFLDGDCDTNPDFCDATAVHIGYCTGDLHLGNNTEVSEDTWGFYFDGHANFAAIMEDLIAEYGLGDADDVLLTGSSAGAIGAHFNVDWLADRLGPEVAVKGVPVAGWYTPGSLPGDLPSIYSPSDYDRFVAGEKGNPTYDAIMELDGMIPPDRVKMKDILSSDCLADYAPNEWWVCRSLHQAYRYIKSPIFNVHSQYDSNQIFQTQGFAPENPDRSEVGSVKSYIEMWGNATRVSLQQILNDDTETPKDHPDGVFSASCLSHGTSESLLIDGQSFMPIVHDWFFDLGQKTQYYRLIETCTVEEGGLELPCNPAKNCGFKKPKPKLPPKVRKCAAKMVELGCAESKGDKRQCLKCARRNRNVLFSAGCSKKIAKKVCEYAAKNNIGK